LAAEQNHTAAHTRELDVVKALGYRGEHPRRKFQNKTKQTCSKTSLSFLGFPGIGR